MVTLLICHGFQSLGGAVLAECAHLQLEEPLADPRFQAILRNMKFPY